MDKSPSPPRVQSSFPDTTPPPQLQKTVLFVTQLISIIYISNSKHSLKLSLKLLQLNSFVEKRRKWRFWNFSSFVRVIGFCSIPNIRKIDNKVEEETKRRQKKLAQ